MEHPRIPPSALLAAVAVLLTLAGCVGGAAVAPDRGPGPPAPGPPQLHGRVVDPTGRPMAGIPVKLYGGLATRWEVGSTVTDADGRYAFETVEGRGLAIDEGRATYVGVCVGEGLGNLNPAAYLPWTDVTIPRGETLEHDVVLDLVEVQRRVEAERARR